MSAFRLGLTGSIGMGKSTTAALFAAEGVPVWDADAAVHRLYAPGGAAVAPLSALFPAALQGRAISRDTLKSLIAADPAILPRLEAVVHPLVAADRATVLAETRADLVVLDIPLLFENSTETQLDATLLVTAPPELQRARVLARQMPDAQKRKRATHIVETLDLPSTTAYVKALIAHIRTRNTA